MFSSRCLHVHFFDSWDATPSTLVELSLFLDFSSASPDHTRYLVIHSSLPYTARAFTLDIAPKSVSIHSIRRGQFRSPTLHPSPASCNNQGTPSQAYSSTHMPVRSESCLGAAIHCVASTHSVQLSLPPLLLSTADVLPIHILHAGCRMGVASAVRVCLLRLVVVLVLRGLLRRLVRLFHAEGIFLCWIVGLVWTRVRCARKGGFMRVGSWKGSWSRTGHVDLGLAVV